MAEKRGRAVKGRSTVKRREKADGEQVVFTFQAPEAQKVCIAGEFNNWQPDSMPMKKDKSGIWKAKVTLPTGRYEYKLIVDSVWEEDRCGEVKVQGEPSTGSVIEVAYNDKGTKNFVFWVS